MGLETRAYSSASTFHVMKVLHMLMMTMFCVYRAVRGCIGRAQPHSRVAAAHSRAAHAAPMRVPLAAPEAAPCPHACCLAHACSCAQLCWRRVYYAAVAQPRMPLRPPAHLPHHTSRGGHRGNAKAHAGVQDGVGLGGGRGHHHAPPSERAGVGRHGPRRLLPQADGWRRALHHRAAGATRRASPEVEQRLQHTRPSRAARCTHIARMVHGSGWHCHAGAWWPGGGAGLPEYRPAKIRAAHLHELLARPHYHLLAFTMRHQVRHQGQQGQQPRAARPHHAISARQHRPSRHAPECSINALDLSINSTPCWKAFARVGRGARVSCGERGARQTELPSWLQPAAAQRDSSSSRHRPSLSQAALQVSGRRTRQPRVLPRRRMRSDTSMAPLPGPA